MLVPLYPPGHKRENTRKDAKDWTLEERKDFDHAVQQSRRAKLAAAAKVLGEIDAAKATLGKH